MVFGCLYYRYDEADAEVAPHVAQTAVACKSGHYDFAQSEVLIIYVG